MMRSARLLIVSTLAAVTVAAAASCSNSSSSTGPTPQQLQGNYVLTSLAAPSPTLTPPAVSGTLALTLTNYTLVLTITGTGTQYDGGTYTINGNNFVENSDSTGFTYNGTLSLTNDSLHVFVTTPGGNVTTTWQKQ